jgi:hypothetical protein
MTDRALHLDRSRQAAALSKQAAQESVVDRNADHGGTSQLKALAGNSDLFVLVWQSAKHAATDSIAAGTADQVLTS